MKNEIHVSLLESVLNRIDEISAKTLGSYIKQATNSAVQNASVGSALNALRGNGDGNKLINKSIKRYRGVTQATDKLTKKVNEEEQIDEISKDLASRYFKKSIERDKDEHKEYMDDKTSDSRRKEIDSKSDRREKGIDRALKRMDEEQLEERNKMNAHRRKMMDAARGAAYKLANPGMVPPREDYHTGAQAHNKAIGRALRNEEVIEEGTIGDIVKLHRPIEGHHYGRVTGVAPGSIKVKIKKTPHEKADDYHYTSDSLYSHVKHGQYHRVDEESLNEGPSGIKPEGEKAFAGRHKIEIVDHGVSNEVQHTAHNIGKDKSKKASYEDGEDAEAYYGKTPLNPTDLGIKGKLKEAADDSKYHADAAERHQKAAEAARADGKKMLAKQHEKKAAKHREIYKKHQDLDESFGAGSPYGKAYHEAKKHIRPEYHPVLKHAMHKMEGGGSEHEEFSKIHLGSGHEKVRATLKKHNILEDVEALEEAAKDQAKAKEALAAHMKLLDRIGDEGGRPTPADMAKLHKLRVAAGHKPKKVNEESSNSFAEVIAEISSKVLGNYIDKASAHLDKEREKHGYYDAKNDADRNSAMNRHFHANKKRIRALHKATLKFVSKRKEEKAKG